MSAPAPSTTTLPGGRVLAYDDVGDRSGAVVVYFHGAPDCRLARHPDDGIAAALGVRLIALDRPGYGRSDPASDPTLAGTAVDIVHLLDDIGAESCRLLAWSAGALPALAAATLLGARCTAVTAYAAMPPLEAGLDPAVLAGMPRRQPFVEAVLGDGLDPAEVGDELSQLMLPVVPIPAELAPDMVRDALGRRALAEVESVPGLLDAMAASHVEAAAVHGRAGVEHDMVAELSPGQLDAVLGPVAPVRLVYGERDPVAGPPVGEWYRTHLPKAALEVWEGATHHSLFPRWRELLAD